MALAQNVMEQNLRPLSFDPNLTRPQTASIQVTEFGHKDAINPKPVKREEKDVELLEEFLSPRKLRALTGVDNLEEVDFLEMHVDADETSLGNFGMYLPNLRQLKLSNSIIPSVRDLGTAFSRLEVLWMPRCCLECLDGLVTMSSLTELYLAYNEIRDISPCGMLEELEILDLEGNMISDYKNLAYLAMCPKLTRLSMEGNPFCLKCPDDEPSSCYRETVTRTLPQLTYLDDIPVSKEDPDSGMRTATLEFDEHWNFINSLLKESGLMVESEAAAHTTIDISPRSSSGELPSRAGLSSSSRSLGSVPSPLGRPGSSLRPSSAQKRITSSRGRLGTASSSTSSSLMRPLSSNSAGSQDDGLEATDESNLTSGTVVCGNISKALRRRRTGDTDSNVSSSPSTSRPGTGALSRPLTAASVRPVLSAGGRSARGYQHTERSVSAASGDAVIMDDKQRKEQYEALLTDLHKWRENYEITRRSVEAARAPQVMKITHDESVEILSDRSQDSDDIEDSETSALYNGSETTSPAHTPEAGASLVSGRRGAELRARRYRPATTAQGESSSLTTGSSGDGVPLIGAQAPPTKPASAIVRGINASVPRPVSAMPALGGKMKRNLPVLPSKPSVPRP